MPHSRSRNRHKQGSTHQVGCIPAPPDHSLTGVSFGGLATTHVGTEGRTPGADFVDNTEAGMALSADPVYHSPCSDPADPAA